MLKILLVDDNSIERQGIKFLMDKNQLTFEIHEVDNGCAALDLMKREFFNILITDIRMPLMDGVELVKKLRDFNNETAVIIISGYSDFEYAKSLLQYNVADYLLKPIDFAELMGVLNKLKTSFNNNEVSEEKSISQAINIMKNEFQNPITLDEVASRVFLSASYFSKKFKEATGTNFVKYLTNIRLAEAENLLVNSSMKVSSIASYVGLPNASYFNRIFKEAYGVTPLDFRNEVKND